MALNIVYLVLLAAIFGALFRDGLWSNTITLINAVTAGLVATGYFEPLAAWLTDYVSWMTYNWDALAAGGLFGAVYGALRLITGRLSRYRVRFYSALDNVGSMLVALAVGWVGVCFLGFVLHTAPLGRNFLYGSFQPEQRMFFGLGPDRLWLGFVDRTSHGGGWGRNAVDAEGRVTSGFDPQGEFMIRYASRRSFLEKQESAFYGFDK